MTTCTNVTGAIQSQTWTSPTAIAPVLLGTYIDWDQVDALLYEESRALTNGLPYYHNPLGIYTHMEPRARARFAVTLLSTLEMMYGQDIGATYSGSRFVMDDFRNLLMVVLWDQDKGRQLDTDVPFADVYGNSIPSGKRGWWSLHGSVLTAGPFHYPTLSANAYTLLRRNATALQALYDVLGPMSPWRVVSLEHKFLATGVEWPFLAPAFFPTSSVFGGGLTGMYPWLDEIDAAGSLTVQADCQGGAQPSNFWGESIGVVLLTRACADIFNRTMCWARSNLPYNAAWWVQQDAPTATDGGLGATLSACFDAWRQRHAPPSSLTGAAYRGPVFDPALPLCPCEWVGTIGNWASAVSPAAASAPAVPDLINGQDWDCSLHQLTRAVMTMYLLGRTLDTATQRLVVDHLQNWQNDLCFDVAANCPSLLSAYPGLKQPQGTAEMYREPGLLADPCHGVYPSYAPTVDAIATAAMALSRSGALQSPDPSVQIDAVHLAKNLVETVSTLYRPGSTGGEGWAGQDTQDPSSPVTATLDGTFFAVATLRVLNKSNTWFSGCAGNYPASSGPTPDPGLDTFFDVLGGGVALDPSLFPDWADAFYEWNGMAGLLNTSSYT